MFAMNGGASTPFPWGPHQCQLSLLFLILAKQTCVRWNHGIILIYIFLLNFEHLFKCFPDTWDFFCWKFCLDLYCILIEIFDLLFSSLLSTLNILDNSYLQEVELVKIFLHSEDCCFEQLVFPWPYQTFFIIILLAVIMYSNCMIGVLFRKSFLFNACNGLP